MYLCVENNYICSKIRFEIIKYINKSNNKCVLRMICNRCVKKNNVLIHI